MSKRVKWLIAAVVGLGVVNVGVYLVFFRGQADANRDVHEKRTSEYVAALTGMAFDQLIDNLADEQRYLYPGVITSKKHEQDNLDRLLSNRGFLKLLANIAAAPREQRDLLAVDVFGRTFATHTAAIERVLRSHEDSKAPKNTQSMDASQYGVGAGLVVTAKYGRTKELLKQFDAIQAFAQRIDQRLAGNPAFSRLLKMLIAKHLQPDQTLVINALAWSLDSAVDLEENAKVVISDKLAKATIKESKALARWDADVTAYDFLHVIEGRPVDTSKGTVPVVILRWNQEWRGDTAKQDQLIGEIIKSLRKG